MVKEVVQGVFAKNNDVEDDEANHNYNDKVALEVPNQFFSGLGTYLNNLALEFQTWIK